MATKCPADALGRSRCAEFIRQSMRNIGAELGRNCEITVSTAPPLVASPYGANGYECPHGVTYWVEPTSEQIAEWNREGVR
jgi:hypothetical protein